MPIERIEGYDEFIRDTTKIQHDLPDAMREASLAIARDLVNAASGAANTSQAQLAAQEFSVDDNGQDGAIISNSSVLFFGSEFGGQGRPETMHFPPHNGREGYWFYPTKRANDEQYMDMWDKGVEAAMKSWDRRG